MNNLPGFPAYDVETDFLFLVPCVPTEPVASCLILITISFQFIVVVIQFLKIRWLSGSIYEGNCRAYLFTRFWYQESTIGAAFFSQTLALNDATVKFEIWDTAGQERYHSLAPMYYRGAAAAVIVYDITSNVRYSMLLNSSFLLYLVAIRVEYVLGFYIFCTLKPSDLKYGRTISFHLSSQHNLGREGG